MALITGVLMSGIQLSQVASALTHFFGVNAYTGNGVTQSITNGVNLSTNNGLLWVKSRSATTGNILTDTVRGLTSVLESDSTAAVVSAGALTANGSIASGVSSWVTCISQDGTSVYVLNQAGRSVSMYQRNASSGTLTANGTAPTNDLNTQDMCISPDGLSVYIATYTSGNGYIYTYTRNTSTGVITQVGSTANIGSNIVPHSICVSPDNKSVYVVSQNANKIFMFSRVPGAIALTATSPVSISTADTIAGGICVSPDNISVYVTNGSSNSVSIYTRNSNTSLLTSTGTIATGTHPDSICISADGTSVYTTNSGSSSVSIFTRDTGTGSLSGTSTISTIATGTHSGSICISQDGTQIYIVGTASSIYNLARNTSTGALTISATTIVATSGYSGYCICISPDGKNIYYPTYNPSLSGTVYEFTTTISSIVSVSNTGYTLGANPTVNTNAATYASWSFANDPGAFNVVTYTGNGAATQTIPHSLTVAPVMSIIKCISAASDWPVSTATNSLLLDTNAANNIGILSGSTTIATGSTPETVCISVDGTSVYVTNNGSTGTSGVSAYTRNTSTGTLTLLTSYTTGANPFGLCISADGKTVYVTNSASTGASGVSAYTRNTSTGILTLLASYTTGSAPSNMCISADGASVYVSNNASSTVSMFSRNISTGALTPLGTPTIAATSPQGMCISPDGTSVYVTNSLSGSNGYSALAVFTRNTSTGMLTSGGTMTAGWTAINVCISSDGAYVYVSNYSGNSISIFSRNTNTGVLTASGTVGNSGNPYGICISADGLSVYLSTRNGLTVSEFSRNTLTGALSAIGSINSGSYLHGICISADGTSVYTVANNNNNIAEYQRSVPVVSIPTATTFTVNNAYNTSAATYVAYLFASLPNTSSVGSYTGDGTSSQIINCGFSSGSRYIMIKRTDTAGDWYVWDSVRGINATGNSPHLSMNTTAAEVTTDASVLPNTTGFAVSQVVATNINVTAGNYIYIAFA